MTHLWTIIGVRDVRASLRWYQALFGLPGTPSTHDHFGQLLDGDGSVLLCFHGWGAHEHPPLMSPSPSVGNGLLLFFRVDGYGGFEARARRMVEHFGEEPRVNPNTGTLEFSLVDPDGYHVTISAREV